MMPFTVARKSEIRSESMLGAFSSLFYVDFLKQSFRLCFCAIEIPVVLKVYQTCKERKINDVQCFEKIFDRNGQDVNVKH